MKNSKLILLLKTFNAAEWRKFGEFLSSPFFNKRKELILFYKYLRNIAPEFEEEKLEKEKLFKKIYPKSTFDKKTLVYLTNYLLKQAEYFLAIIRLEKDEHTANTLILDELIERNLDKHYRHYINKSNEALESNELNNNNYYFYKYKFSELSKQHFLATKQRKFDPILQDSIDYLDQFYFFNKLKVSCEMLGFKNNIAANFELNFIEDVIKHLNNTKRNLDPIIAIYLCVYQMLTKEDAEAEFLKLKALLKEYKAVIPIKEKNYPYLFAINYCGAQIRQNNRVYYYGNQYLELYLEGLEEKTLYVDNYLSPWSFKNIVKIGLNLKKFDWTTQFIKNYYTQLKDDFQEDAFHFNMADLFYRKQKYQESQKHLMQVQFSDVFYTLGAKSMLIKIYFETDEEEALLSLLASFTIYLKRNKKIANNIKETYLNFTSLLYQLLKAKPDKLPVVVEKIRNVELLANRKWLLNAININKSMLKPA